MLIPLTPIIRKFSTTLSPKRLTSRGFQLFTNSKSASSLAHSLFYLLCLDRTDHWLWNVCTCPRPCDHTRKTAERFPAYPEPPRRRLANSQLARHPKICVYTIRRRVRHNRFRTNTASSHYSHKFKSCHANRKLANYDNCTACRKELVQVQFCGERRANRPFGARP